MQLKGLQEALGNGTSPSIKGSLESWPGLEASRWRPPLRPPVFIGPPPPWAVFLRGTKMNPLNGPTADPEGASL